MKKIVFTCIIMLMGLSSYGHTSNLSEFSIFENRLLEAHQNILSIELEVNGDVRTYEFGFKTQTELKNFEIESVFDEFKINALDDAFCEVSITVKVRVGIDSNFFEASASVSGIACDDVVGAIKRLKQQLVAGLQ